MNTPDVFAPPQSDRALAEEQHPEENAAYRLRRKCLAREGTIKGMVWYAWLSAASYGAYALFFLIAVSSDMSPEQREIWDIPTQTWRLVLESVLMVGLLVTWCIAALGLARLTHMGRIATTIAFGVSIVWMLIASIEGIFFDTELAHAEGAVALVIVAMMCALYAALTLLMWSKPAAHIFSPHYRETIIPATSRLRASIPWWMYIILAIIILSILGIIIGMTLSLLMGDEVWTAEG